MSQDRGTEPNLVEVYASQGQLGARVAKSKLEAAGIPALLSYRAVSLIFGLTVDGIGKVRVLVPERFAEEAREMLAEDSLQEIDREQDI